MAKKQTLIEYVKSGGIAGFNDELKIYEDGNIETKGNYWGNQNLKSLTKENLDELLDFIENKGFFSMDSKYHPKGAVFDGFHYVITCKFKGKKKTVYVKDFGQPPKEFLEIRVKLEELLEQ